MLVFGFAWRTIHDCVELDRIQVEPLILFRYDELIDLVADGCRHRRGRSRFIIVPTLALPFTLCAGVVELAAWLRPNLRAFQDVVVAAAAL